MIAKYGDCMTKGFTGDRVAEALTVDGVDMGVIYGPEFDMWIDFIDPEMQAAMARAVQPLGPRCARSPTITCIISVTRPALRRGRAVEEITVRLRTPRRPLVLDPPQHIQPAATSATRYYDPIWDLLARSRLRLRHARVHGSQWAFRSGTIAARASPSGIPRCTDRGHGRLPVDDRARRVRAASPACGSPTWKPAAAGCRRGCTASTSISSSPARVPDLPMNATEYFKRNCWISTECEDKFVADVMRWLGDDHIVYESDFPHPDSKYPHTVEHFLAWTRSIDRRTKRKILWDNAVDLYRFPPEYLPEIGVSSKAAAGR